MELSQALDVWWVLPAATFFATIALSTGLSGALFFSPFFLLAVGLAPAQAIGAGLLTEAFGTSFGSFNYFRQRVVDFKTVRVLLLAAIPAGIIGALVAQNTDSSILQIILGIALIVLSLIIIYNTTRKKKPLGGEDPSIKVTTIHARDGRTYKYRTCRRPIGVSLAGIGAFLNGMVSAGLPEVTTTQLIVRCHLPPRVAVATAIFVLTVTDFFAAGVHALSATPAWFVVVWSIPGVMIGAQIGPRLQGRVPAKTAERIISIIFMALGALVIITSFAT